MVALKTGPKKCFWGGGEELPSHFVNCSIDLESLPIVWFWGDILMHWHIDWCRQWYFRHHQDHLHHSSWYGSYHKINCGRAFFIFNLSSSLFHIVSFSMMKNCDCVLFLIFIYHLHCFILYHSQDLTRKEIAVALLLSLVHRSAEAATPGCVIFCHPF